MTIEVAERGSFAADAETLLCAEIEQAGYSSAEAMKIVNVCQHFGDFGRSRSLANALYVLASDQESTRRFLQLDELIEACLMLER